jgi:amino acid transporter
MSHTELDDDVRTLHRMGYTQELSRCLGQFSNFAISLSIICILAGGLTSFHLGFSSVGGAAVGVGWPVMCLLSLVVAATMGQIASAFPTAGGLYHWASILGGRGLGWGTAWFNLAGLVTVLAAINVGAYEFAQRAFWPDASPSLAWKWSVVGTVTCSQGIVNHLGIRVTRVLTDFSGWWILLVSVLLTAALLIWAPSFEPQRLITFHNFSGTPHPSPVWPASNSLIWLFALSLLLPAYTITGFDASAHAAEETRCAARSVPRGIVRSVWVSGLFGWWMLGAVVLAMPSIEGAAAQGSDAFFYTLRSVVPSAVTSALLVGIVIAQYLCGLATVTSASRMAFAFARDGGLPLSQHLRWVSPTCRTPPWSIWAVCVAAFLFTLYTPVYSTITAVCVTLLYISYVLPTAIGVVAHGRWWTHFGPWHLGRWFRPLGVVSVVTCASLIVIGMQPPNERAIYVVGGMTVVLVMLWGIWTRHTFSGPPLGELRATSWAEETAARKSASPEFEASTSP